MPLRTSLILPLATLGVILSASLGALPARAADADGTLTVEGTLTDEGVECQAMRGDDGQLYTLAMPLMAVTLVTGDKVRVVGKVAQMSTCMQGTTIQVTDITKVE